MLHYNIPEKKVVAKLLKPSEKELILMQSTLYNNILQLKDLHVQISVYQNQKEFLYFNIYQFNPQTEFLDWIDGFEVENQGIPQVFRDNGSSYILLQTSSISKENDLLVSKTLNNNICFHTLVYTNR